MRDKMDKNLTLSNRTAVSAPIVELRALRRDVAAEDWTGFAIDVVTTVSGINNSP